MATSSTSAAPDQNDAEIGRGGGRGGGRGREGDVRKTPFKLDDV